MVPIYDPVQLTHPKLQEFAVLASWISVYAETIQELEELNMDVPPENLQLPDFSTPWPWYFDYVTVALHVVRGTREEGEKLLEEYLTAWMAEDRENWLVLRITLIDPWKEPPGLWLAGTPEWIRILGTIASEVHAKHGIAGGLGGEDRG
jgi:hypothetical protein